MVNPSGENQTAPGARAHAPGTLCYEHGITAIDSGYVRPMLDAIHLVEQNGRVAVVDSGCNASVPAVLHALDVMGLDTGCVDWILLTHVHLDHAGGAGLLLQSCPNARVAVHPRGARHMVDPGRLMAGTIAVYGEDAARRMYGDIVPIPADRIVEAREGDRIELAERRFTVLDTPGHARHHVCYHDDRSNGVFVGDTFGLSYRELDDGTRQTIFPATTPVQFDPAALRTSIDRLLALHPDALYLTHYGRVHDVARLGTRLHAMVADFERLAIAHADAGPRRARLLREGVQAILLTEAREQDWPLSADQVLELFRDDVPLNAAGLESWLEARHGA
jgi:glyoxylase-like metal-dependent hydrolase (beta-lactamase superfamily II)